MALKTVVKVGNVSNLSDARYCAGMGVELVGFVMDTLSEDYTSPEKLKEIKSWLAGVLIVGETKSNNFQEIEQMLHEFDVDMLQIEHIELLPQVANLGKPIILKLDFENRFFEDYLTNYQSFVEFFLVDGGEFSDYARYTLKEYAAHYPIVLDFGITAANVIEVIDELPIKGIGLKGSAEIRPGFKDYDELSTILEAIEIE